MTEPPFTFDAAEQQGASTADEPEKDRRRTVVALGALGAVVLAAGAFLLLGSGGEESAELAFTPVKPAARAEAPATPGEQAATLPAASDVKLGHNPFEVLYAEPAAAEAQESASAPQAAALAPAAAPVPVIVVANAAPVGPVAVAPVAPAPAAVSPVRPAPTAPAAAPATTKPAPAAAPATTKPAPAPAPVPVRSTVKLTSVSAAEGSPPVGTFVLDGKEHQGAKGAVFDGKLLVVDLLQNTDGDWYANLQVGDGSPFEVHKNQEVVVP